MRTPNQPNLPLDPGPQLMWATGLTICASMLLALFLLTLAVGWWRHFSRWLIFYLLLTLVACVAAAFAAQQFYATYASWRNVIFSLIHLPPTLAWGYTYHAIVAENQQATVVGWSGVIVTGMLLAPGLVGMCRLRRQAVR